jgi:hypothetical protein
VGGLTSTQYMQRSSLDTATEGRVDLGCDGLGQEPVQMNGRVMGVRGSG